MQAKVSFQNFPSATSSCFDDWAHLCLEGVQHLDCLLPGPRLAIHIDEDVVGHQVRGAALPLQKEA